MCPGGQSGREGDGESYLISGIGQSGREGDGESYLISGIGQ
jgi:hypothetical protein